MFLLLCFFFFQAEDGIRDLVRSRGLGDVYKRQAYDDLVRENRELLRESEANFSYLVRQKELDGLIAVSYTHLTLPTSDLV
mgnify:CR=1 FL=1